MGRRQTSGETQSNSVSYESGRLAQIYDGASKLALDGNVKTIRFAENIANGDVFIQFFHGNDEVTLAFRYSTYAIEIFLNGVSKAVFRGSTT